MDLCEGTPKHHHEKIVHAEGWRHCPLCAALEANADLEQSLDGALAEVVELQEERRALQGALEATR